MPRKLTTCEWILKAVSVHGDAYTYFHAVYSGTAKKIEITCPVHGSFWQLPRNHLQGRGCPECHRERKIKYDHDLFVRECSVLHGEKYDYGNAYFDGQWHEKIEIICPLHGSFWQTPSNHLHNKHGCPKCINLSDTHAFVEKAINVHDRRYDYTKSIYVNSAEKIEITCPVHGSFWQTPNSHLRGHGCPECQVYSGEDFIREALLKHGMKYDYSHSRFVKWKEKLEIVCPVHGSFWQTPQRHIHGRGCPKCYHESLRSNSKTFVEQAKAIHSGFYEYSNFEYVTTHTSGEIVCPVHGSFWQTPDNHKRHGCPSCSRVGPSSGEQEINDFIVKELEIPTRTNDRQLIAPKELDVVIPHHRLAIEFNGLYWHSTACQSDYRYHQRKTDDCEAVGYRLIHIYEDEWRDRQDRLKDMLTNILRPDLLTKYNARSLKVDMNVKITEARKFMEDNHIQGHVSASIKIGLRNKNGALIAVMYFRKSGYEGVYELNRFATVGSVRGAFSKLLTAFSRTVKWKEIYTYADRRYSQGQVYEKNGFTRIGVSGPSFDYVKGSERHNRQKFMKYKLESLFESYDSSLTEKENMRTNGFEQIWNSGYVKFVLTASPNTQS